MKMPSQRAQRLMLDLIESAGSDRAIYEYIAGLESALRMFFALRYPTSPGKPGSGDRADAAKAIEAAKAALGE